jgi:hypothetical protein
MADWRRDSRDVSIKLNDKDNQPGTRAAQTPMLSNTLHFIHRRSRQSRLR